jgi:CheY-like chemotaxis protein
LIQRNDLGQSLIKIEPAGMGGGQESQMLKDEPVKSDSAEASGESADGARAQILIVDDDRAFCETIARCLAQRGYDVVCADGGEAAAEAIADRVPDVIVTDVMMPGMDGIDLMNWLSDQDLDVPVIVISGEGLDNPDIDALEAGAPIDARADAGSPAYSGMSLHDRAGGRATAVAMGAVSVLKKPFGRALLEHSVAQALTHGVTVH